MNKHRNFLAGFPLFTIVIVFLFSTLFVACEAIEGTPDQILSKLEKEKAGDKSYTVTFDRNGGSGTVPAPVQAKAGADILLPGGSGISKDGFAFDGWNTLATGLGTNYSAGVSFTVKADITLYAKWSSKYTVTFDKNGATGGTVPGALSESPGTAITIPGQGNLEWAGYVFGGWNTLATGLGTKYSAGDPYTENASVILYAIWYSTCTVTFSNNGGSGAIDAQTVIPGSVITLPDQGNLALAGFTFDGWNMEPDGLGTNYNAKSSYTVSDTVTLYARWASTITFSGNGSADDSAAPPKITAYAGSAITLPDQGNLVKTNYVFGGWNSNSAGTGTKYDVGESYSTSGSTILYAKWNFACTVTFNPNSPTSGTAPDPKTTGMGMDITLPGGGSLVKNGWSFDGWNTQANGLGTNYPAGYPYTVNSSITLYANWSQTYTVSFSINDGAGTIPDPQTVSVGFNMTLPNSDGFSRDGYTFDGWNTKADGLGDNYPVASYTPTASITLYARWTSTVTFDLNSGGGTVPSSQTVPAGSSITLPQGTGLSRTSYVFNGWSATTAGTGTKYDAGASYMPTGNITLYAKWTPIPVASVSLNKTTLTLNYGDTDTLTATISPSDALDQNVNWSSSAPGVVSVDTGGKLNALAAGTSTITATTEDGGKTTNCMVTVNWLVSFNTNGGGTVSSQNIPAAGKVTRPANPGRSGYVFDYWYTDAAFTTPYNFNAVVTGNITLYAKWVSQTEINAMAAKNMVFVPGGSFDLGKELNPATGITDNNGTNYSDGGTVSHVTMSGFYMGKYEVTQTQYQTVMLTNPSYYNTSPDGNPGQLPVEQVSWYNAVVFCNRLSTSEGLTPAYTIDGMTDPDEWISAYGTPPTSWIADSRWNYVDIVAGSTGYRLATEAQWEYAAKGGDGSLGYYTYAGSDNVDDVAWYASNSLSRTHEVGMKTANGLGLYDMSGNVWEWCWDWYGGYTSVDKTNPTGASAGTIRVFRGGGWDDGAGGMRSVYRNSHNPDIRGSGIGFRIALPSL